MTADPAPSLRRSAYSDPFGGNADPTFARTSKLAIASFVLGILCCIPGLGSIAVALGAISMYLISQSKGTLEGRPLAVIGMVLGMLSLTLWVFAMWGAVVLVRIAQRNFIDPVVNTMLAIDRGDYPLARQFFLPSVQVSDAQFDAFRAAYQADAGSFKGFSGSASLADLWGQVRGRTVPTTGPLLTVPSPLPFQFQRAGDPKPIEAQVMVAIPPTQDLRDTVYDLLFHNKAIQGQAINLIYQRDGKDPVLLVPAKP